MNFDLENVLMTFIYSINKRKVLLSIVILFLSLFFIKGQNKT